MDPRHDYIAEELDIMDAATAISGNPPARQPVGSPVPALYDWKPEALRLAAEQKTGYGKKSAQ